MKMIYCAAGNPTLARIAVGAGFWYGAQLPGATYFRLWFADQNWKKPDRAKYMEKLAEHKPGVASVVDWEKESQLAEVLDWAEEASQYVTDGVMIIPKVIGGIERLPTHTANGRRIILGYSVPTRHGSTPVPHWEFTGWPVHLLGGSPHEQLKFWRYLSPLAEVVSVDGNYSQKEAVDHYNFWRQGGRTGGQWIKLPMSAEMRKWLAEAKQTDNTERVKKIGRIRQHKCFRLSCQNIRQMWERAGAHLEEAGPEYTAFKGATARADSITHTVLSLISKAEDKQQQCRTRLLQPQTTPATQTFLSIA
jgi:hypothetical protein